MGCISSYGYTCLDPEVSLTSEIEALIAGRIASGRFRSASEVGRAALRLLEADERQQEAPERRNQAERRQRER